MSIKVELKYNPYIKETIILFNEKAPRINSQVEKYDKAFLQTWINELPQIFHDEMNGYDFHLEFTGTDLDFEELKYVFCKKRISTDQVRLFHKGKIGEREDKVKAIDNLMKWLDANANNRFDYVSFKSRNNDLLEGEYPFLIVEGRDLDVSPLKMYGIAPEVITHIDELQETNIRNTPILFYVDNDSLRHLQTNLEYVQKKKNAFLPQMFFFVDSTLDKAIVERIIKDLGVEEPQMVDKIDDEEIIRFFNMYQVTEYIYDVVSVFRKETDSMRSSLDKEIAASRVRNAQVYEEINMLNATIERLKDTSDRFSRRTSLEMPQGWIDAKNKVIDSIKTWKNRKTKMNRYDDALVTCQEFESDVFEILRNFDASVKDTTYEEEEVLVKELHNWYEQAQCDVDYSVSHNYSGAEFRSWGSPFAKKLLEIKHEDYVTPKEGFGGLFRKSSMPIEPVLETTYYYQEWRDYVAAMVEPIIAPILQKQFERLKRIYNEVSERYIEHIGALLDRWETKRDSVASQLSDAEQVMQKDDEWLTELTDIVEQIERG